jgi:ATP-binding cassette, subfamily C (CFTR/MRP), member 4
MDSIYRGPIHSTFAMMVNGMVTLRSYGRIQYFHNHFIDDMEKTCNVTFSYFAIMRWMATTLDMLCILFILSASVFAVLAKDRLDTELLAFTLQILTDVIIFFSFSTRMGAEIENNFTSSQRLYSYTQIESEDHLSKEKDP